MVIQRVFAVCALLCATLFLSGCFVVAKNLPAGSGPVADERLIGAWRGFEADQNKDADAYLHFLKPDRDEPLKLVWVEDSTFQVYEVHTMIVGGKNVFAARIVTPAEHTRGEIPDGYFVGFYEVKGDEVVFNLLDGQMVGELIGRGKVKGIKPPGKYDFATLTGSPAELARFLASPDAAAALAEEPARLRRLSGKAQNRQ